MFDSPIHAEPHVKQDYLSQRVTLVPPLPPRPSEPEESVTQFLTRLARHRAS
ncbi:MAG: hypothetical protein KDK53_08535 [Maritimibacter sp.]|nr:hypothetical protein [Maritimibacter sp.]